MLGDNVVGVVGLAMVGDTVFLRHALLGLTRGDSINVVGIDHVMGLLVVFLGLLCWVTMLWGAGHGYSCHG